VVNNCARYPSRDRVKWGGAVCYTAPLPTTPLLREGSVMVEFHPIPTHGLFVDLTGKQFGQLTVLGFLGRPKPRSAFRWWCRCSCGVEKSIQGCALTTEAVISCGCFHRRKRTAEPFEERNKRYQKKHRDKNKERRARQLREWRSKSPEKRYEYNRDYAYRSKYGMRFSEAQALLDSQDGKCLICKDAIKLGGTGGPGVDHDHTTGAVRGVLCKSCNLGLGCFRDNEALLLSAIAYLKR
jgi:hypothetical protein